MSVREFHDSIALQSQSVRDALFSDADIAHSFIAAHSFIDDYENLKKHTSAMPGDFLRDQSIVDLQRSFHSLCNGQYVSAFIFQRLYFEKYLFYIQLSSNELSHRMWEIGLSDLVWASVVDDNKGIFSANFCRAFDGFSDQRLLFLEMAKLSYRECSEFVHGNFQRVSNISVEIAFNKELTIEYLRRTETMHDVCLFAWCNRFLGTNSCVKSAVADVIIDRIGHLSSVRQRLEAEG